MNISLSLDTLRYGHRQPLFSPLSMQCRHGQIWAILGANGRGKSTLLDTLTGVLPPLGGKFSVEGGIAIVPQSFRPAFGWQVRDVVLMGRARHVDLFAQPGPEDELEVQQALVQLGIAALANRLFRALSGGQQQRLCIARAMAVSPSVLLMDEPASALDPISTAKVEELIHELKERYTIVIVTHNMQQAARVSDKTAFFYMGQMVEFGDTKKIFTNPEKEATQNYITGRFG